MLKQKHSEKSKDELFMVRKASILNVCVLCFMSKCRVIMRWLLKKTESLSIWKATGNDGQLDLECLCLPWRNFK